MPLTLNDNEIEKTILDSLNDSTNGITKRIREKNDGYTAEGSTADPLINRLADIRKLTLLSDNNPVQPNDLANALVSVHEFKLDNDNDIKAKLKVDLALNSLLADTALNNATQLIDAIRERNKAAKAAKDKLDLINNINNAINDATDGATKKIRDISAFKESEGNVVSDPLLSHTPFLATFILKSNTDAIKNARTKELGQALADLHTINLIKADPDIHNEVAAKFNISAADMTAFKTDNDFNALINAIQDRNIAAANVAYLNDEIGKSIIRIQTPSPVREDVHKYNTIVKSSTDFDSIKPSLSKLSAAISITAPNKIADLLTDAHDPNLISLDEVKDKLSKALGLTTANADLDTIANKIHENNSTARDHYLEESKDKKIKSSLTTYDNDLDLNDSVTGAQSCTVYNSGPIDSKHYNQLCAALGSKIPLADATTAATSATPSLHNITAIVTGRDANNNRICELKTHKAEDMAAFTAFFNHIEHAKDTDIFRLAGTWQLKTLTQVLNCCLAMNKPFAVGGEPNIQLSVKYGNNPNDVLHLTKNMGPQAIIAEIDKVLSKIKNNSAYKDTAPMLTDFKNQITTLSSRKPADKLREDAYKKKVEFSLGELESDGRYAPAVSQLSSLTQFKKFRAGLSIQNVNVPLMQSSQTAAAPDEASKSLASRVSSLFKRGP